MTHSFRQAVQNFEQAYAIIKIRNFIEVRECGTEILF